MLNSANAMQTKDTKTAMLSIISNTALTAMKFAIGLITGSVSITSEAIHSLMGLFAAIIAFFAVKISGASPDVRRQYGHGKFENLSGVIEAVLIFVAAIWIMYESIHKIIYPTEQVSFIWLGALVMFLSASVNTVVSRKLYKVAEETDSIALKADALHLKADVLTSLGVAVGLMLIWLTGLHILDPVIAILVALFILKEAFSILQEAFLPLVDVAWDQKELDVLDDELNKLGVSYHDVRTRKSGSFRFLAFHMLVNPFCTVQQSHDVCDSIEEVLKRMFANLSISIHVEPDEAANCTMAQETAFYKNG